jgi:hypothetical protein
MFEMFKFASIHPKMVENSLSGAFVFIFILHLHSNQFLKKLSIILSKILKFMRTSAATGRCVEIHRNTWYYESKNNHQKKWGFEPSFKPVFLGGNFHCIEWQIPTLNTNPNLSNKTKSLLRLLIRFQDALNTSTIRECSRFGFRKSK